MGMETKAPTSPSSAPILGGGGGAAHSPLSRPMRGRDQKPAPHRGGPQSNRMPPPMRPRLPPGGGSRSSPFPLAPFSFPSPLPRRPLTSLSVEEGGTRRRIRSPLGASGHGAFSQDPRRSVSTLLRNQIYWGWRWEGTTPPPQKCAWAGSSRKCQRPAGPPHGVINGRTAGHRVGAKRGEGGTQVGRVLDEGPLVVHGANPGQGAAPEGGPWTPRDPPWTAPFASAR